MVKCEKASDLDFKINISKLKKNIKEIEIKFMCRYGNAIQAGRCIPIRIAITW